MQALEITKIQLFKCFGLFTLANACKLMPENKTFSQANHDLQQEIITRSVDNLKSLEVQGSLIASINNDLDSTEIKRRSNCTQTLSEANFKFAGKRCSNNLQQLLICIVGADQLLTFALFVTRFKQINMHYLTVRLQVL